MVALPEKIIATQTKLHIRTTQYCLTHKLKKSIKMVINSDQIKYSKGWGPTTSFGWVSGTK